VVFPQSASDPIAPFPFPVVFEYKAWYQRVLLLVPLVLFVIVSLPIAVLAFPILLAAVVEPRREFAPIDVLVLSQVVVVSLE
jgi:hypothetical protein